MSPNLGSKKDILGFFKSAFLKRCICLFAFKRLVLTVTSNSPFSKGLVESGSKLIETGYMNIHLQILRFLLAAR